MPCLFQWLGYFQDALGMTRFLQSIIGHLEAAIFLKDVHTVEENR